jgi:nucleotide-binding universal stress UspA family protein
MITASSSPLHKKDQSCHLGPAGLRFRSIMVGTDCSAASATAVKLAADFAKQFHSRLYVLHAVLPEFYGVGMAGAVPELALADLENAREQLHKYAERIPELRTVKHKEIAFLGSPGDAIQSAGQANGVDLLVVGSHGRRGLAKLTLGSVAEWAISHLSFPVLVAGPSCDKTLRPIRSILLATDLSQHALSASQYASSMAQDYNGRLTIMHVLSEASTAEQQAQAELSAMAELRRLVPGECGEWCTLQFQLKTGDIAAAILESARQDKANLIVLGVHRRLPLADHALRNKLSAIIRGAHCPVLLVPNQAD